jgi:hypothetical protein
LKNCGALTGRVQKYDPTGKSFLIYRNDVNPHLQKYFCFRRPQISDISLSIPCRSEGRIMIVANVGRDAVDVEAPFDEGR